MNLAEAIVALRRDDVLEEVHQRVEQGESTLDIIGECRGGMVTVGDRFASGEFFLAELVLAGEIFKAVVAELDPQVSTSVEESRKRGTVLMATPKGDIHDLGKGIVVTMFKAYGFEVHDLGVDVDPGLIVEKVRELRPQFVGLSALLTTALGPMKQAAEALLAEGLRDDCKLMIGGGVTTAFVREYVGADFQTTDVMEGVQYCLSVAES